MGNKRTYRSTPEPRFVKRALETASGKNIDDAISKFDKITYNSDTNTFEISSNLEVNGVANFNGPIVAKYGDEAIVIERKDHSNLTISYNMNNNALLIINEAQSGIFIPFDDSAEIYQGVTSKNLKTIFGNQSIFTEDGTGNIDLYKHYLTIGVKDEASNITDTFSILVQSSSNVDCSSATGETQKLKTLLKASGSSIKTYEYGPNIDFSSVGMLLWTGTILCITAVGGELDIVNIVDRVETV